MKIGIIGGTGREGTGIAQRWAKAGHQVTIGSRDAARAAEKAKELSERAGVTIQGADNAGCVADADIVLLTVPYGAHASTLGGLKEALSGKILIDITVPLQPPKVRSVNLPAGQSAAMEAQALLGESVKVVGALHHISSGHLDDPAHEFDCDVLVCGDDPAARAMVVGLVKDLGLRGIEAGVLRNAIALESLTPVLLFINQKYGSDGSGIRITGLPNA
ncbi:MAG: NADPH-dependent F420 reductase [Polyangiales bacterium]